MDILSNFAESISELLFDKKITIEELANKVGVNESEIYRYKRKEYLPSTANLIKIADAFNYSIDVLLGLAPYVANVTYHAAKPFADVFKLLLDKKEATRYGLCKEQKLAPSRVDDWYHGKRLPTIDNLLVLAKYFNCSIDCLFGRE